MQTNNHKITDYDVVLDAKFGCERTPEPAQTEVNANAFYSRKKLFEVITSHLLSS